MGHSDLQHVGVQRNLGIQIMDILTSVLFAWLSEVGVSALTMFNTVLMIHAAVLSTRSPTACMMACAWEVTYDIRYYIQRHYFDATWHSIYIQRYYFELTWSRKYWWNRSKLRCQTIPASGCNEEKTGTTGMFDMCMHLCLHNQYKTAGQFSKLLVSTKNYCIAWHFLGA